MRKIFIFVKFWSKLQFLHGFKEKPLLIKRKYLTVRDTSSEFLSQRLADGYQRSTIRRNKVSFNTLIKLLGESCTVEDITSENIELYKPEGDFSNKEMIDNLVSLTGIFPIDLVMDNDILRRLEHYQVPPLGEWDNDLGVAWFIPREVTRKKTKNGKPYWVVKVIDDTSTMTTIRCWSVKEYDQIHLNRPYAAKLEHNSDWGFSTRSVHYTFKLLG